MESKIKFLIFIVFCFLMIANVSAQSDILKPAKVNQSYIIFQTCSSCTYVNVTVSNVNGIVVSNQAMNDNGSGIWTYDITPTLTSRYDVTGQGDLNGVNTSFVTWFDVTPSGRQVSTGDSILYFLFSLFLIGVMILDVFFIFIMPSGNEKNDRGFETSIVKIKYFRVVLIVLFYGLMALLLNFLIGLSENYSALSMFSGIFGFIFKAILSLAWVFTIIMVLWIFVMLIHDTNVKKQIKKMQNGLGVMRALDGR